MYYRWHFFCPYANKALAQPLRSSYFVLSAAIPEVRPVSLSAMRSDFAVSGVLCSRRFLWHGTFLLFFPSTKSCTKPNTNVPFLNFRIFVFRLSMRSRLAVRFLRLRIFFDVRLNRRQVIENLHNHCHQTSDI